MKWSCKTVGPLLCLPGSGGSGGRHGKLFTDRLDFGRVIVLCPFPLPILNIFYIKSPTIIIKNIYW